MSFSENLKKIRRAYHLSQEELAELLDVSRQAVSKWEQGQGYPEVEKLLLLSSKLNISLGKSSVGKNFLIKVLLPEPDCPVQKTTSFFILIFQEAAQFTGACRVL